MTKHTIRAKVDLVSIDYRDYTDAKRRKHEGQDLFLGIHVPLKFAPQLTLSDYVIVEIEVPES